MLVAWVMASVVIIAPGRKDRGADSERQSAFVVALSRNSIVALVYMRVRVMVPMRVEARHHRLSAHLERQNFGAYRGVYVVGCRGNDDALSNSPAIYSQSAGSLDGLEA